MDTWPVVHGGCYHVTEIGGLTLCETLAEVCRLNSHGVSGITRGLVTTE
jgi:hypothetical protein